MPEIMLKWLAKGKNANHSSVISLDIRLSSQNVKA
jgi:hypothetical protein